MRWHLIKQIKRHGKPYLSWDKTQDKAKDPFLIAQNSGEVWRDKLKWLLLKGINSKGNLVRKKNKQDYN